MPRPTALACLLTLLLGACNSVKEEPPQSAGTAESGALEGGLDQTDRIDSAALLAFLRKQDPSLAELTEPQLDQVSRLRLNKAYTPLELASLARLPRLRELTIWRAGESFGRKGPVPAPTDEDLRVLAGLSRLETLRIGGWNAPFTDTGIAELERLPQLKHLHLVQAQGITDEAMLSVARMGALETLNITYTRISDRGLEFLLPAEKLESVRYGWAGESKRWLASFLGAHSEAGFRIE